MNRLITLISIVSLIFLGAVAVGCGGDGGSDGSSGAGSTNGGSSVSDEDAVRKVANQLVKYTTTGNAKGLCSLFVPGRIDRVLGEGRCVAVFRPGVNRGLSESQFVVDEIVIDGDKATVKFAGEDGAAGYGESTYVKVDGEWYLDTPDPQVVEQIGN